MTVKTINQPKADAGEWDSELAELAQLRKSAEALGGEEQVARHHAQGKLTAIAQAEGGDWIVNEPTLFLAGEAGAERATFTRAYEV